MIKRTLVIVGVVIVTGLLATMGVLGALTPRDEARVGAHQPGHMTQMERSGEMHEMLEQHQRMMGQMRMDASPLMLQRMQSDPMWQMMQSGEMVRLMEEHQAEIDQMLGRGKRH